MVTYNFDLLDLADGESGDAAVSVVVGKKKIEAAVAAKLAKAAEPAAQEKKTKYFSYYTKLQHDSGVRICQQDLKRLSDALRKLRGEETKLREQPAGNEAHVKELLDEQMKLRQKEATLMRERKDFYNEYEIPLPEEKLYSHSVIADPGSNYNGVNDNLYNDSDDGSCGYSDYGGNNDQYQTYVCDGGEHYPHGGGNNDQYQTHVCHGGEHYRHGHDERQVGRGHDHCNNGDRHIGETEPTDVDGHIAYHSVVETGIQDWVYIDSSGSNSVAEARIQDWVYIDISAPNNHTKGA